MIVLLLTFYLFTCFIVGIVDYDNGRRVADREGWKPGWQTIGPVLIASTIVGLFWPWFLIRTLRKKT